MIGTQTRALLSVRGRLIFFSSSYSSSCDCWGVESINTTCSVSAVEPRNFPFYPSRFPEHTPSAASERYEWFAFLSLVSFSVIDSVENSYGDFDAYHCVFLLLFST
jgi:hypothetical protein